MKNTTTILFEDRLCILAVVMDQMIDLLFAVLACWDEPLDLLLPLQFAAYF